MKGIERVLRFLSTSAALLAGVATVILMLLIGYSVFMRYVMRAPVRGTEEVGSLLVMLIVFLPLAYTFQTGGHIRTDIVLSRVRPGARRVLDVLAGIAAVAWSSVVWIAVTQRTLRFYEAATTSHGGAVELWIPSLSMVLGTGLLVLYALLWTFMRGFGLEQDPDDVIDPADTSSI